MDQIEKIETENHELRQRLEAETAQRIAKDKQLESKFEAKTVQLESKLERFGFKSPELVGEVLVSVAVVLVAAILAMGWRRFQKD